MAPVTETCNTNVWVIYQSLDDGETTLVEAHVSRESADAAMKNMGHLDVEVLEVQLKSLVDVEASKKSKKRSKSKSESDSKKEKRVGNSDSEDDDDDSEGDSSDSEDDRQTLPDLTDAKPNCLKGLKIVFAGTFKKNRKTLHAAAIVLGAEIPSSLKKADYAVLGSKPGDKKLEELTEHNVDTISLQEFFSMLKTGFPKQALKADHDRPKKKQKT